MSFNFPILNENGEEIIINTLQDLPILTTGLLEVNLIKILKFSEENKRFHNHTIEFAIVYLYFLKRVYENGTLHKEILKNLSNLFHNFVKLGTLYNIESLEYVKELNPVNLKEKLDSLKEIKNFYGTLCEQEKNVLFDLSDQFCYRMVNELLVDVNTPFPNYFSNKFFLKSKFKYLSDLEEVNFYGNWVSIRKSISKCNNYYLYPIHEIINYFSKKCVESGNTFRMNENKIIKALESIN